MFILYTLYFAEDQRVAQGEGQQLRSYSRWYLNCMLPCFVNNTVCDQPIEDFYYSIDWHFLRDKCFDTQEKSVPHNKVQKTHKPETISKLKD